MPAAAIWRASGLDTLGADLRLTELRLCDLDAPVDAGATITSSHPPLSGALDDLRTGGAEVVFAAQDVASPGFYVQWIFASAVDVNCVVYKANAERYAPVALDLSYVLAGRHLATRQEYMVWPGARVLSPLRPDVALFDVVLPAVTVFSGPVSGLYGFGQIGASADGRVLYVPGRGASGVPLRKSVDYGRTFSTVSLPGVVGAVGYGGVAVTLDGQGVLVAGAGAGGSVRLSVDDGATWQSLLGLPASAGGWGFPSMSDNGMVLLLPQSGATEARAYVSRDGGEIWHQAVGPVGDTTGLLGSAMSADGRHMVVASRGTSNPRAWISRDFGESWALVPVALRGEGCLGVAMSRSGKIVLLPVFDVGTSSTGQFAISTDYGVTWSLRTDVAAGNQGFGGAAVSDDEQTLILTGRNASGSSGVQVSVNAGVSWSALPVTGSASGFLGSVATRGGFLIAGGGTAPNQVVELVRLRSPVYTARPNAARFAGAVALPVAPQNTVPVGACVPSGSTIDVECGGHGTIYGTVELYAQSVNIPLPRRVRLHRSRDGLLVRETWSDAQGNYRFDGITDRYKYDVIAWDHEGLQQSVVANDLTPERMQ